MERVDEKGFCRLAIGSPKRWSSYLAPSAIISGIVFGEADPPYQHAL
jgi:hypothetical protein